MLPFGNALSYITKMLLLAFLIRSWYDGRDILTNSATVTAYVTGHDRSLTSKMTGWGAVMTSPDRSLTSKMTSWGAVMTGPDRSHTSKMTGQRAVCTATDQTFY